jgi:hypothetical protein
VRNRQTCTIGDLNLIPAIVALMNMEALHVVGEMIGGARVN